MDGIFRKGLNRLSGVLCILSGVALAGLMGFVLVTDPAVQPDDVGYLLFFLIFGLIVAVCGFVSLRVTDRLFLRVEEDRILSWRFPGCALEIPLEEVKAVIWGGDGLTIDLKNGKRYSFMDLKNACELGEYIHERTFVAPRVDMDREELTAAILALKKKNRRQGIAACAAFGLMFAQILPAVFLTGGRELEQFSRQDWTVFGHLAAVMAATFVVFFLLLRRWVRTQGEYHHLLYAVPSDE